jgi:hypothetical protein
MTDPAQKFPTTPVAPVTKIFSVQLPSQVGAAPDDERDEA